MRIEKMKNLRESDYVNFITQMRNSKPSEVKTLEKNLLTRATTDEYSKHQFDQSDMKQESCMIEQHKSELRWQLFKYYLNLKHFTLLTLFISHFPSFLRKMANLYICISIYWILYIINKYFLIAQGCLLTI